MKGIGALVWRLREWKGGDPNAQLADAQELGLDWISLKVVDGTTERWERNTPDQNQDFLPTLVPKLVDAGITVIAWGWTYGRRRFPPFKSISVEEAQLTARVMKKYGDLGMTQLYLVDAEHDYNESFRRKGQVVGLNMAAEATKYMTTLRSTAPELKLYLCSYRFPAVHGDFPWSSFLRHSHGHAPQVYFLENTRDDGGARQLAQSMKQLNALKNLPFVPIAPTYEHKMKGNQSWRASGEQLVQFFDESKNLDCSAAGVWALERASVVQSSAIRDYQGKPNLVPPDEPKQKWTELNSNEKDNILMKLAQNAGLIDQEIVSTSK
jgi:hypothetical protein